MSRSFLRPLLIILAVAAAAGAIVQVSGKADLIGIAKAFVEEPHLREAVLPGHEPPAAAPGSEPAPPAVSVATATRQTFIATAVVTGSLVPRQEILVAAEIEGVRIVSLAADAGDSVAEGEVLAVLEKETLESQLARNTAGLARADAAIAQARSGIAEAEARLDEAKAQLERATPLTRKGFVSESTLDTRQAAARTARAQLAAAKDAVVLAEADRRELEAQRRELQWRLERSTVRAPKAGLLSRRDARIGDLVSGAKAPLFRMIADGEIELEAKVPEATLARLAQGHTATVSVAGHQPVTGAVRLVSPEVDVASRLGTVRIFLGAVPGLKIGAFGRGVVETARSEGLAVPLSAVLYDGGATSVQKVVDGRVVTTPVEIGLTSGGLAEVTQGLVPGDKVVLRAGTFLRDGDAVRAVVEPARVSEAG